MDLSERKLPNGRTGQFDSGPDHNGSTTDIFRGMGITQYNSKSSRAYIKATMIILIVSVVLLVIMAAGLISIHTRYIKLQSDLEKVQVSTDNLSMMLKGHEDISSEDSGSSSTGGSGDSSEESVEGDSNEEGVSSDSSEEGPGDGSEEGGSSSSEEGAGDDSNDDDEGGSSSSSDEDDGDAKHSGGAVFIRWGNITCPSTSELVYQGLIGGNNDMQSGGAAQYLCLPKAPIYVDVNPIVNENRSLIYSTKLQYQPASQHQDASCSVCRTLNGRTSIVMVPARNVCPERWTEEYTGYVMSASQQYKRTEYLCVDSHPTPLISNDGDHIGALLYPVEARCDDSIPCPPYVQGHELTCVVCSK